MRTTVKINESAMQDLFADMGQKIIAADESLRISFAGMDVEEILPEVQMSMTELGINLPDATLRDYAQHISDRADYEFVLQ